MDEALDLAATLPAGSLARSALLSLAQEEERRKAAVRAARTKRKLESTEWEEV